MIPNQMFLPRESFSEVMMHVAAVAAIQNIEVTAEMIRSIVIENRFDFRKSMNFLQFWSNSRCSENFCFWPYRHSGENLVFNSSYFELDDEIQLFFAFSNFLPYFCFLHPNRTLPVVPPSAQLVVSSVSPVVISQSGGEVTIQGELAEVAEVWLCGVTTYKLNIRKHRTTCILVDIPSVPPGLYHLKFLLRNGLIGEFQRDQRWFGNVGILVVSFVTAEPNSEDEFEEQPINWGNEGSEGNQWNQRKVRNHRIVESEEDSENDLVLEVMNKEYRKIVPNSELPEIESILSLCELYDSIETCSLLSSTSFSRYKVIIYLLLKRRYTLMTISWEMNTFIPLSFILIHRWFRPFYHLRIKYFSDR